MSRAFKALTNAQIVCGRTTPNDDDELAFRKGSMSTTYVRTMTRNHRSTLTNLTRNFDASESKPMFDNERHSGTKDSNVIKKTA